MRCPCDPEIPSEDASGLPGDLGDKGSEGLIKWLLLRVREIKLDDR